MDSIHRDKIPPMLVASRYQMSGNLSQIAHPPGCPGPSNLVSRGECQQVKKAGHQVVEAKDLWWAEGHNLRCHPGPKVLPGRVNNTLREYKQSWLTTNPSHEDTQHPCKTEIDPACFGPLNFLILALGYYNVVRTKGTLQVFSSFDSFKQSFYSEAIRRYTVGLKIV